MNKKDLKKAMKPLVKECIQEILLEEGLLSNIVSEVAIGLQGNLVVENKKQKTSNSVARDFAKKNKQANQKLNEHKKRMLDAIGADAYNGIDLFEGTTPIASQESQQSSAGSVDLGNSNDSGVDISSLVGGATQIWDAMK